MALAEHELKSPVSIPQDLQEVFNRHAQTCDVETEVNARNTPCPMPLLKAKQALRNLLPNQRVRVIATDAGSLKDFVAFAQIANHRITHFFSEDHVYFYVLQKGSA